MKKYKDKFFKNDSVSKICRIQIHTNKKYTDTRVGWFDMINTDYCTYQICGIILLLFLLTGRVYVTVYY